jgi:hypothetical protein
LIPTSSGKTEHGFWSLAPLEPHPILYAEDIAAIVQQKKFLYAYGIATYDNGVGKSSATAFGYVYHFPLDGEWRPKGFFPAGPKPYNNRT